ncbi:hypothetical protein Tco_0199620 [Tanacetum coccineum]
MLYTFSYAPSQYVLYALSHFVLYALGHHVLYALSQHVLYALSQHVLYALSHYALQSVCALCTQSACALRTQSVYALRTQSACALRTQSGALRAQYCAYALSHVFIQLINTAYPLPLDTAYRSSGTEPLIFKELQEVMAEPILSDNMEKAPTELNLSITSNDINIELSKEFLVELRKNIYHGMYNEDVVDHIAKNGGLVREKSPLGRNLLRNSSVDSIPNHTMEKMKSWTKEKTRGLIHLNSYQTYVDNCIPINNELKESKYENPPNTAIDSFFKAYEARDIEKQSQTKRKYSNRSNSINEQPNKRRCKAEKFEAI